MKILHIIDHMGIGGAQTIIEGLNKSKVDKLYFYALRKNGSKDLPISKNVYCTKSTGRYSFPIVVIKRFIEKEKIDILHLHLPKSIFLGIILKCSSFRNIDVIIHEHGGIFENRILYTAFLRLFQSKVNLFIAVSEATKQKLMENAGISDDKIKVLYNFVDLEQFDSQKVGINRVEERKKLGLNDESFILGFAGRHVGRKGCRDLIFALGKLKHFKNIKLLIAGDGPKKEEYMKLVNKLGVERNIFFLGYVPDIRWLYSIIDCFVVPSYWEPLGIVALEAHAMGVPVIAANVEGLNEIISDKKTGLLFEPKNEKDLAEKMELIEKDKDLRGRLIKNGLYSVKKYSLEDYIYSLGKIYEALQYEKTKR